MCQNRLKTIIRLLGPSNRWEEMHFSTLFYTHYVATARDAYIYRLALNVTFSTSAIFLAILIFN